MKEENEASCSALRDNIAHKGRNAYYYAHGEFGGTGGIQNSISLMTCLWCRVLGACC